MLAASVPGWASLAQPHLPIVSDRFPLVSLTVDPFLLTRPPESAPDVGASVPAGAAVPPSPGAGARYPPPPAAPARGGTPPQSPDRLRLAAGWPGRPPPASSGLPRGLAHRPPPGRAGGAAR